MLESFAYVSPGSTGVVEWTLRGEELITSGDDIGMQLPIALSRIEKATITLQDERTGDYINTRSPGDTPGAKHLVVDPAGTLVETGDVVIDASSGAAKWRYQVGDTTVANSDTVDVAEYLATFWAKYANAATSSVFDRVIIAQHRMRIPVRPALCVPADVFGQLEWKMSEEKLPLVQFCCEAVTDRFEQEYERLVRKRSDTEYVYIDDDGIYALNLRRFPLESITSVKEISSGDTSPAAFADVDSLDAAGFLPPLSDVGQIGVIRRKTQPFTKGAVVEVQYVGGIARSAGDVPMSLRNAARRYAAFLVKHADKVGITSITAKDSSTILYATDMPKDAQAVFETFRRRL